jgi:hypothetical protein
MVKNSGLAASKSLDCLFKLLIIRWILKCIRISKVIIYKTKNYYGRIYLSKYLRNYLSKLDIGGE